MKLVGVMFSLPLLALPMVAAAQLHVIISGGFSGAYEQLLPEFERSTGIKVVTGSGASQGPVRRRSRHSSRAACPPTW
jgi:molybdate transport system substrate-binding protein